MARKKKDVVNTDGWMNVLTGIGDPFQDKRMSSSIAYDPLSEQEAEALYAADDTAGNIVDRPAQDAMKNWIEYTKIEKDTANALNEIIDRLDVREKIEEAFITARIHGGAAIIPILDDGMDGDMSKPLDVRKIRKIYSFLVFSRWELVHTGHLVRDPRSLYFGLPVAYTIFPRMNYNDLQGVKVHHTRVIRFDGNYLPKRLFQTNNYWHDSVLAKTKNAIRNYSTSFDAASGLLNDFQEGILKSPGVAEKIGAGLEEQVKARLRMFNLTRSSLKTIYIDNEESYETKTRPLTGVGDILDRMSDRLVSASGLPHTVILGEGGKGGLGNEGKSEKKDYQGYVQKLQEGRLRNPIMDIHRIIGGSPELTAQARADIADGFGFKFNSIEALSDVETVALRKEQSITDKTYIDAQVLTPEEIGMSRFGGDKGYSIETIIDTERLGDDDAGSGKEVPASPEVAPEKG